MAQNNRQYNDQDRLQVTALALDSAQLTVISEMTKREGFLFFDPTEVSMILDLLPECYLADFKRFVYRSSGLHLNPLHNESHMEYKYTKGKPKATFVIHIDGYRSIADRTGDLDGFMQAPGKDERGDYVETTIWRKGKQHPFVSRVYFQEFMQDGEYSLYKSKPYHMVAKCGAVFGLKSAFPISGLTSEDEVEAWPADQGPRLVTTPATTAPAATSAYAVGEIKDDKAQEGTTAKAATASASTAQTAAAQTATAATVPTSTAAAKTAGTTAPTPKPSTVIAERLKVLGLKQEELMDSVRSYTGLWDAAVKFTQDQYVEAFTATENFIRANSIAVFRKGLEDTRAEIAAAPASAPDLKNVNEPHEDSIFEADPVVRDALQQVTAKWPMWSPSLVQVAALWCADQTKDAAGLDAFLITGGINAQTPVLKIESLLAITRHLSISSLPALLEYAKKSGKPFTMIEEELSKAVGQSIRLAIDIEPNAVGSAMAELVKK